ncbi:major pollen allergen Ole e 10-like [Capsella rubella]|uniref:major pollen allergen Ole e 10-like n=1 Tax=Capsella rubella TaxID=81985 RepID=UPI000CD4D79F|nr:major pollen allergen Ole e 10-like [Capsella rubella]
MAKAQICICFIIFFYLWSGNFVEVKAYSRGAWCVAKPSATNDRLQQNIDFVCSKMDCNIIKKGGACYSPENLINAASVAMNIYYQTQGRRSWNCNFEGSGLVGVTDPSYGNCIYEFRRQ